MTKNVLELAAVLEKVPRMNEIYEGNEKLSDNASYNLIELRTGLHSLERKIQMLEVENLSNDQVSNIVHDIGEELRHVYYHLNDIEYFSYIK